MLKNYLGSRVLSVPSQLLKAATKQFLQDDSLKMTKIKDTQDKVCICMCVYTHTNIYVYIHTHMYMYIHI
jgi:hypothetical protein